MFQLLAAISIIMLVLCGWVIVQYIARAYAAKYPEQGPYREEGSCCGASTDCMCGNRKKVNPVSKEIPVTSGYKKQYKTN